LRLSLEQAAMSSKPNHQYPQRNEKMLKSPGPSPVLDSIPSLLEENCQVEQELQIDQVPQKRFTTQPLRMHAKHTRINVQ
jgi:hypothetical protein